MKKYIIKIQVFHRKFRLGKHWSGGSIKGFATYEYHVKNLKDAIKHIRKCVNSQYVVKIESYEKSESDKINACKLYLGDYYDLNT